MEWILVSLLPLSPSFSTQRESFALICRSLQFAAVTNIAIDKSFENQFYLNLSIEKKNESFCDDQIESIEYDVCACGDQLTMSKVSAE